MDIARNISVAFHPPWLPAYAYLEFCACLRATVDEKAMEVSDDYPSLV
jgi:hypothetical protein